MVLGYPYGWNTAVGLFFLLILVVILRSEVVIKGHLRRVGSDDDAELNIKALFGLIRYRYKVPIIQFTGTSVQLKEQVSKTNAGLNTWQQFNEDIDAERVANYIDKFKSLLQMTRDLTGWARKTLTKIRLLEWNWTTSVGTGDAMWTAMATGAVWSVKTSIIGLLSQMVKLKAEPKMNVQPIYQCPAFQTEWSCIAQIRFGYAILAGLQLLVRMRKMKGGVKAWQNILFKA
ncbi:hypothetical protein BK133_10855 [Paenibacillus sp. FSL H8-0548]|uniref:DUF2953 domain-containing protein n=1 Tax=Paenibacillus sp. FSL H8-0548 TaxID=1920422 RepID=UPI00096D45CD|nr:DUF2953 domain-containing protein [Paenibacillus sp. FSL H8-0548]OMF35204.1 hypothetical protein BK133_10855 [Paenibacillus sp. FSL H8-0548]